MRRSMYPHVLNSQTVSRRLLTAEDRVRTRSPRGICGGQSGAGTCSSPNSLVSPVSIIPPRLSILIYHLEDEQQAVGDRSSETFSVHHIDIKNDVLHFLSSE
jgi:hypothetical protein